MSSYRWAILGVTIIAFVQTHLHRMAFPPLIPTFVNDLGLSYAGAGTIQTAYFWTYTAAQVPIGLASDRWGARVVMLASMTTLTLGALAFAASAGQVTSVLARMAVGLGAAAVWVPSMRLMSEWFPEGERGRVAGLISTGGGLGAVIGLVVVPWLAVGWGWRLAYGATIVPALVTLALVASLVRRGPFGAAGRSVGLGGLRQVLATPAIWPINLSVLLAFGGYISFMTFLPAFLVKDLGLSEPRAGFVTSLITAGSIVSYPIAGVISDRLGLRKPVYLTSLAAGILMCVAFAVVGPVLGGRHVWTLALGGGMLLGGMIQPFVIVMDLFPAWLAATASGVANGSCFVGAMVLPIVLGRVVDVTGEFTLAFLVAAAVGALAFGAGLLIGETGHRGGMTTKEEIAR